jgi:LacI family transcriptional regulator
MNIIAGALAARKLKSMTKPTTILLAFRWYEHRVHKGIIRYASEQGWHISPYNFSTHFFLSGWPADGAITWYSKETGEFVQSLDMPKVDITVWDIPQQIPRVTVDNQEIGRMAARHFLERGFKHFAYYSWPSVQINPVRKDFFFQALVEEGVPEESLYEIQQLPNELLGQWELHQEHILKQLEKLPRPLAVFTSHDELGATFLEICMRSGIQVPEEVAVLGVDNVEHICEALAVPLSSIDVNLERLGYTAAQQLDRLMKKEISCSEPPLLVPVKGVIVRQSSDTLAVPHPKVAKALKFITEHFHEAITLEDICHHAEMSKRGMEKAFLRYLGFSPATELRRIRLANAKRMLTETDEKISTIAHECGYSNNSNLSAAFSRETGMTPRAYRIGHSKA